MCTTLSNLQRHQKTHNTDSKRNDIQNSNDVKSDMIDDHKEIVVDAFNTISTGDEDEVKNKKSKVDFGKNNTFIVNLKGFCPRRKFSHAKKMSICL